MLPEKINAKFAQALVVRGDSDRLRPPPHRQLVMPIAPSRPYESQVLALLTPMYPGILQ